MFKNIQLYKLNDKLPKLADIEAQLERAAFRQCGANEVKTRGWISPRSGSGLCYATNGQKLIKLQTEEKILPSHVVSRETAKRCADLEKSQGYKPGRKQQAEVKELVIAELLPKAFTKISTVSAWIDTTNNHFVIDASSQSKAEELLEHLRHTLDDFPVEMFRTKLSPTSAMATWIAEGEAPSNLTIDNECELREVSEDKATVRYIHHALDGEDIYNHISAGKLPTKLAMTFDDRISFVLHDDASIKKIKFLDLIECEQQDNEQDQFDADFAIMTGEFQRLILSIYTNPFGALGGEANENQA